MIAVEFLALLQPLRNRENLATVVFFCFSWVYRVSDLPRSAVSSLGREGKLRARSLTRSKSIGRPASPSAVTTDHLEFQARYRS